MAKKTLPEFVPPMMAESAKAPFDSPDWIFEIKLTINFAPSIVVHASGNGDDLAYKIDQILRNSFTDYLNQAAFEHSRRRLD